MEMMERTTIECPDCHGLCVIGTSVGSNPWRGRTYDCDTCHGTGKIELFGSQKGEDNQC